MLPTFVIGLREGLEAALIVGIVAAFLVQQGRRDAMRWMWLGVVVAILLCAGAAVALRIAEENLPQKEQEQLETIIALVAVGMITWMIVWMRRHAADLKGDLQATGRARAGRGLRARPRAHGVPRGAPRGPRDRGVPARRVPAVRPTRPHRHRRALGVLLAVVLGYLDLPRRA